MLPEINEKGTAFSTKNIFSKNTSFTIQVDSKFFLKDTISSKHVFSISHPDNTTDFSIFRNYFYAVYLNSVYNYKVEAKKTFMNNNFWHRYTMCYSFEKDVIKIFCDEKEIISFDSLTKKFDISQWFYGLSFGNGSFFYSPRFMNPETYIDNAKVFNRSISPEEIFSETKNGLTAFWSFEKTDNELAFDEINNLPLIMWEDYAIVNEEISYLKK
ncbi:MAG: hypothetical protein NTU73_13495 [Ignavibacteriae bacterium]|nr:hypothetical protein [Ignavibacteriota bacterium]